MERRGRRADRHRVDRVRECAPGRVPGIGEHEVLMRIPVVAIAHLGHDLLRVKRGGPELVIGADQQQYRPLYLLDGDDGPGLITVRVAIGSGLPCSVHAGSVGGTGWVSATAPWITELGDPAMTA